MRIPSLAPAPTILLPLAAALGLFLSACGGGTGSCVRVYEFEGTVSSDGWTRSECEEHCNTIGRTLQCYFEPRTAAPTAVGGREVFVTS